MSAKHTPGPWSVPDGGMKPAIYSADGDLIAVLDNCGDRAEADARLLAAAPSMLAALIRVDRLWRMCWFADGSAYDAAHHEVGAAIAAARGDAS